MSELGSKEGKAKCIRHNVKGGCPVPSCHIWSCGFSCTAFSHYNTASSEAKGTIGSEDGCNASADTFGYNLSYMLKYPPLLGMNENVEAVDDECSTTNSEQHLSNLTKIQEVYRKHNFLSWAMLLTSSEYALPQIRKRYYIGSVFLGHVNLVCTPLLQPIKDTVEMLKFEQSSIDDFLLKQGDPLLKAELQSLQAQVPVKEQHQNKCVYII